MFWCFFQTGDPFWISGQPPEVLQDGQPLTCTFKARYRQSLEECTVCFIDSRSGEAISQGMGVAGTDTSEFTSSSFCRVRHILAGGKQLLQVHDRSFLFLSGNSNACWQSGRMTTNVEYCLL